MTSERIRRTYERNMWHTAADSGRKGIGILLEKIQAKGAGCDEMQKVGKGEHAVCCKLSGSI